MAAWIHDEGMAQGSRARQEDDYGVFELPSELGAGDLLLVLADGMGGERGGALASALAVREFIKTYDAIDAMTIPDRLEQTLLHVNVQMGREAATDPEGLSGMGCTLLAVVLAEEGLYWISVGDSPLWLWRQGRLCRLNEDHAYRSILAHRVAAGEISADTAARHPDRNALMSAVTGDVLDMVDLPRRACALREGDQILLASDGVLTLSEQQIAAMLKHYPQIDGTPCQALLSAVAAHARPHQDNITVLWARASGFSSNHSWWRRTWRRLGTG